MLCVTNNSFENGWEVYSLVESKTYQSDISSAVTESILWVGVPANTCTKMLVEAFTCKYEVSNQVHIPSKIYCVTLNGTIICMSLSSLIFNSIMRDFHFLVYLYIKHWSSKTYNAFRIFRRIESQLRLTSARSSCKFMRRKSPLYQVVHQNCFPSRFVTIIERGMLH